MIPQLEKNFFHLESGGKGFDQDGSANSVVGDSDVRLGEEEYVIPETSFKIVLQLGQVKIGTGTTFDELFGIVIKVKSKVEKRA